MLQVLYPVFEIDGEEYVADTSMLLTSNPPQYNAFRLSDKKHVFVLCSKAYGSKVMYPQDFYEFMHGKSAQTATITLSGGRMLSTDAIISSPNDYVIAVTHPRPKTTDEKIEEMQKEIESLRLEIEYLKGNI